MLGRIIDIYGQNTIACKLTLSPFSAIHLQLPVPPLQLPPSHGSSGCAYHTEKNFLFMITGYNHTKNALHWHCLDAHIPNISGCRYIVGVGGLTDWGFEQLDKWIHGKDSATLV